MEKATFKKIGTGVYEIFAGAERVGAVTKGVNGCWIASDEETGASTHWEPTRKGAVESLIKERAEILSEIAAAKEIIETVEAQDAADEQKEELQAAIDAKIQKANYRYDQIGYPIGSDKYNLKGSKLLDFIEFMHLYSYGSVIDFMSFDKLCEEYAADDPESSADSHSGNFGDCWGDYKRAWQKAQDHDQLCSCCQTQDLNSFGTERVEEKDGRGQIITVRSFNCSQCGGSGIKPAPLKLSGKMITVSMDDTFTCESCGTQEKKHSTSDQSGLCISCEVDSVEDEIDEEIQKEQVMTPAGRARLYAEWITMAFNVQERLGLSASEWRPLENGSFMKGGKSDYQKQIMPDAFQSWEEYQEHGCSHRYSETINVSGTDETICICHDCGIEA